MTQAARLIVLLLTATVDTGQVVFIKRRDPKRRFKDYEKALKKWCRVPVFHSIIFCENSAFDISSLRKWAASAPEARTRLRFVSFRGNDFPPHLGKGYGDIDTLKHAISLAGLDGETILMKVTGRYYVRNVNALCDQIRAHPECEVFGNMDSARRWADFIIFAAKVSFYEKYLFPLHSHINDSAGVYSEHVLADAIQAGMAAGIRWMPWTCPLRLSGVSGTFNEPYSGPRYPIARARIALARVRMWALARTYRLRRLLGLYRRPKNPADPARVR